MRILRTITFCLIYAVVMLFGINSRAATEKQGGRFLFLVETSSAMDANKTALRNTLHSIIETGLDGQMQYGDTIGLWTYNDKLNAGFPMIFWRREHLQDITNAVDFFMGQQKFAHRGDLSKVMPMLQNVIKASQKLTIIWITTGNDKITGTPFDSSIDELQKEFRDDFRKQKIPFVTLLAVRKGAITDFTVNPGDSKIRLPAVMEKETAEAKAAATHAPPPAKVVAPAPAPKKPTLIIEVGPSPEEIERKKAAEAAKAQQNVAAAVVTPQANTSAPVAASVAPLVTNKPVAPPTNAVAPVQTTTTAVSNAPVPAATSAPVAVLSNPAVAITNTLASNATTNVVSNASAEASPVIKPAPAQEPAPALTVAVTAQPSTLWIALAAGGLVLVAAIVLLVIKQANAPKGPSFISQSMTRDRLNPDASKPSSDNPADHE